MSLLPSSSQVQVRYLARAGPRGGAGRCPAAAQHAARRCGTSGRAGSPSSRPGWARRSRSGRPRGSPAPRQAPVLTARLQDLLMRPLLGKPILCMSETGVSLRLSYPCQDPNMRMYDAPFAASVPVRYLRICEEHRPVGYRMHPLLSIRHCYVECRGQTWAAGGGCIMGTALDWGMTGRHMGGQERGSWPGENITGGTAPGASGGPAGGRLANPLGRLPGWTGHLRGKVLAD